MKPIHFLFVAVIAVVIPFALMGQTDPSPQLLPYSENFDNMVAPNYPNGWIGWSQAVLTGGFQTAPPTGDRVLAANGTAAQTTNNVYDFSQKIGFLNSGTTNHSLATAIATSGLANITVVYDIMTIRDASQRTSVIGLQYRIGNSGNFTDIAGSQYHNDLTNQVSGTAGVNVQSRNLVLPPACNNQPVVQLRFISKDSAGTGARPSFAIDNFSASGIVNNGQPVGIAVSADTLYESQQTQITITATTQNPVTVQETLTLSLMGTGITAADAQFASAIVIPVGQTSGSTTLTILNDSFNEGTESATLALATLSAGLTPGSPSSLPLILIDNDSAIHFNAIGQPFGIETFDSLSNSGNANALLPRGIYLRESGTAADNLYGAQNGSSTNGNAYSLGSTGSTERCFGGLTTGSVGPIFLGARFVNSTGQPFNALKVSYTGEQWRCGGNGVGDTLFFQVSTNADSLHTGTWTSIPVLHFASPFVDTISQALDGNLAQNQAHISDTAVNLGIIQPGQSVWIRWRDNNVVGSDDAIGIDDLSVEPLVVGCLPASASVLQAVPNSGTAVVSSLSTGPINTQADGVQVLQFQVYDGGFAGDFDNLPTQIRKVGFSKGLGHTAGNFNTILSAAALFSGNTKLADAVLSADSLVFVLQNVEANDDDSLELSLRISLAANGQIQDQSQLQVSCSSTAIALGTLCTSSQWGSLSSAISDPGENSIDVIATQLKFSNISAPLATNTNFSATVCGFDVHGNADKSARDISFSKAQGTGTLSSVSGLGPISSINGCASRNDLRYDIPELMVLRATDNLGLTADTSLVFPIQSLSNLGSSPLSLYPNPAPRGGKVQLSLSMGSWRLLDLTGRLIQQGEGSQLETGDLKPGLYLIQNQQGLSLRFSVY